MTESLIALFLSSVKNVLECLDLQISYRLLKQAVVTPEKNSNSLKNELQERLGGGRRLDIFS